MELNRDEAFRARQIAETKFLIEDTLGARKFAVKAQSLFPGLEGIRQMLVTLDVHIAADNKICGEADWYGILGVNPLTDAEIVRMQYRKLALMTHPEKNKFVGANAAFKLVCQAWSLLSDKSKRLAYEVRRNAKSPTSTYVHHYPFYYIPTQNLANGIRGRILLDKFFHMFSPELSATTTSINQQNQAPLSLRHRHATSFAKSIAKINQGKQGYVTEVLKTLSITLGTQLFRSAVIQGAIKPSHSQLACTSLGQQLHNLNGADTAYGVAETKPMLNEEKGDVFTVPDLPKKTP